MEVKPSHRQWGNLTAAQYITKPSYMYALSHVYTCCCDRCMNLYDDNCTCGYCSAKRTSLVVAERGSPLSQVSICDRCESMALGKAMGSVEVRTDPTKPANDYDLCPACVTEFVDWYHNAATVRTGKAFKEPYRESKPDTVEATERTVLRKVVLELMAEASPKQSEPKAKEPYYPSSY